MHIYCIQQNLCSSYILSNNMNEERACFYFLFHFIFSVACVCNPSICTYFDFALRDHVQIKFGCIKKKVS